MMQTVLYLPTTRNKAAAMECALLFIYPNCMHLEHICPNEADVSPHQASICSESKRTMISLRSQAVLSSSASPCTPPSHTIVFITVVMSVFCHRAKFPMRKKRPSNSPFSDESDSLLSPPCADSCGFVHFESLIKILQHFLSHTLEDRLHSWICLKRILHDISH